MPGNDRLLVTELLIEEHAEWHGLILKRIFYAALQAEAADSYTEAFRRWSDMIATGDDVDRGSTEILARLHADLIEAGNRLGHEAAQGRLPDETAFDAFQAMCNEMLSRLARINQDLARTETGVDPVTGLRNKKRMVTEILKEMERRNRRGSPFSVVLARIDNYKLIQTMTTEGRKPIMARLGSLILKCVRSFDDAYSCGDGEFALSLKQATTPGGTAAINRLRDIIDNAAIMLPDGNGGQQRLTMSYCVSEPLPNETIDTLFANMRLDLNRYKGKGGTSLEYAERSALSRLLGDL